MYDLFGVNNPVTVITVAAVLPFCVWIISNVMSGMKVSPNSVMTQ